MESVKKALGVVLNRTAQNTQVSSVDMERPVGRTPQMVWLPKRYQNKTSELLTPANREQLRIGIAAINDGMGVFLTGGCGSGKTHLGVLLLQHAENVSSKKYIGETYGHIPDQSEFLSAPDFFLELRSTFNDGVESEGDVIGRYSYVKNLMIDDIGAEKVSDWSRQMFYTLIDRRYRENELTIITSNLSLDDLAKSIDDRISSRIVEMCVVIKLEGDHRVKMAKERIEGNRE